jgi:hypothetical protein
MLTHYLSKKLWFVIVSRQGEQIGQTFACWAKVFVGQFFLITEGAQLY